MRLPPRHTTSYFTDLGPRANIFLAFRKFNGRPHREAPYRGPSVREKERPGVEFVISEPLIF